MLVTCTWRPGDSLTYGLSGFFTAVVGGLLGGWAASLLQLFTLGELCEAF